MTSRTSNTAPFPLKLAGAFGSPYSLKMRAVLRYRLIPFVWVLRDSKWDDLPDVPVRLLPTIAFPEEDGSYPEAMIDSSPLIERLETMHHDRRVVPGDPVMAFLDALVEDYGDEWVTKAMYHYRWYYQEAIDKAGALLPLDLDLQQSNRQREAGRRFITKRQIGRRAVVGCTDENRPVIESSYERLLDILEDLVADRPFVAGNRPGRGDFALYGQLAQLTLWDPVSARLAVARAPRVVNWVLRADDLSWWSEVAEGDWLARDEAVDALGPLLSEIGRTYVPFMLANERALDRGAPEVVRRIGGVEYRQGPFKYQGKCLSWLRQRHRALSAADRSAVDAVLSGTRCEELFG